MIIREDDPRIDEDFRLELRKRRLQGCIDRIVERGSRRPEERDLAIENAICRSRRPGIHDEIERLIDAFPIAICLKYVSFCNHTSLRGVRKREAWSHACLELKAHSREVRRLADHSKADTVDLD